MNEDIDIVTAWADIVIQRWESKITRLNIVETSELLKSFTSHVFTDAKGDPFKVMFTFLYYGIFPDMGVGKGVPYNMVASSNRKAKPWYSRQFTAEVHKLAILMAERYGEKALDAISLIQNKGFSKFEKNDDAWKASKYNQYGKN